jgi:hypothetical protein
MAGQMEGDSMDYQPLCPVHLYLYSEIITQLSPCGTPSTFQHATITHPLQAGICMNSKFCKQVMQAA